MILYIIICNIINKCINKPKMKMKKTDFKTFKKIYNDKYEFETQNCINLCNYIQNIFNELNTNKYNLFEKLNDFMLFNHFNLYLKNDCINDNDNNNKFIKKFCYEKQFFNMLNDKIDFEIRIILKYDYDTNQLICCKYNVQKTAIELYTQNQLKNMIL